MKVSQEQWRIAADAICDHLDDLACNESPEWQPRRLVVAQHGLVQPCGGGAFVECVIWVPDAAVKGHGTT